MRGMMNRSVNPKISIVLPCYQSEGYLPHMVQAIQGQTFTDWELIVVGNGSGQDAQKAIIAEFSRQDSRISYVSIEPAGVSRARNIGLDLARGEWISFVDVDDDLPKDWLARYLAQADQEPDIIVGGLIYRASSSERCQDLILPTGVDDRVWRDPAQFLPIYLSDMAVVYSPWTKLFNVRFLRSFKRRFDEDLSIFEDCIFCLECALCCSSMRFIPQTGYVYCVREGSAIGRYHAKVEEPLVRRRKLLAEVRTRAGFSMEVVRQEDDLQFEADSLDVLLNVYRIGSPFRFSDKIRLIKRLFAEKRLGEAFKTHPLPTGNLPLVAYWFAYRVRSAMFCACFFSFLFMIRRLVRRFR